MNGTGEVLNILLIVIAAAIIATAINVGMAWVLLPFRGTP